MNELMNLAVVSSLPSTANETNGRNLLVFGRFTFHWWTVGQASKDHQENSS